MYEFIAQSMLIFAVVLPSGLKKNIEFERCSDRVYSYMTSDKDVAMAIRRHPLTKKGRIVDKSQPEEDQSKEVEEEKKVDEHTLHFDNITKAKNYLRKTFEVDVRKLKSPESVKEKAKELGVIIDF